MESDREVLRPSEITKERVEAALKADKGSEAKMVSFAVQELTKAGENFVTFVVRVNVKFSSENGDDVVSYAVKYDPRRCKAVKDFILACFHKELVFYQNIVHDIQAQLHEIGLKPLRVPKCFYTSLEEHREVIFLEDISKKGFKKSEFEDGLDVAHTTLILEELARLHAASYLLKAKIPDLAEKYPVLNLDWVTYADSARRNTQGLFGNIMDSASKLLRHIGGREVAVAWLEENKTRAAEIIEHELRREPPFDVLCHGDCWNNNVLFRYTDKGVPVEVILLDLQIVRLASLATDLNYVLHTSLEGHTRRENFTSFLAIYYERFTQVLSAGGSAVPFSLEDLTQEYRNHLVYGLIMCLMSVVFSLDWQEDASYSEGGAEFQDQRNKILIRAMADKPQIRDKFLFLIDEMIENGIMV
ncbi:uncharacterized protein [Penaeus vannamei]|uniref:uncharacterized protein n=1 Tax=Penaeus vannamei TaxID=6689 RepID=UPI00387FACDA